MYLIGYHSFVRCHFGWIRLAFVDLEFLVGNAIYVIKMIFFVISQASANTIVHT